MPERKPLPTFNEWWRFFVGYSKGLLKFTIFFWLPLMIAFKYAPWTHITWTDLFWMTLTPSFMAYIIFMIIFVKGFGAHYAISDSEEFEPMPDMWKFFAVILLIIVLKYFIELI